MSIALEIKRDITISYPIDEIKLKIRQLCANSKGKVMLKNENDLMNTFSIQLMGGMMVFVPISIQLQKTDDNNTSIHLNTTKSTNTPNQANEIIDKFLDNLSKYLKGEVTETSNNKGGCFGVLIIMILLGGGISIYSIL
jgi:hypothetical protein